MSRRLPRSTTLTDQVVHHVRNAVSSGEMTPNKWYSVYQLSEELGISRSPVREALLRLEEAGLVQFTRNRGFQIRTTSAEDVAEIFALRLALEPAAAGRAAIYRSDEQVNELSQLLSYMHSESLRDRPADFFRYDQNFHDVILEAGNSSKGRSIINRLRANTRLIGVSTAGESRTFKDIYQEHLPIFEGIQSRDPVRAAQSMEMHLRTTGLLLLQQALPKASPQEAELVWNRYTSTF